MKEMHSEKYENCRKIAIREGFIPVICIKDDSWHDGRIPGLRSEIGEMFCAIFNPDFQLPDPMSGPGAMKSHGPRYHVYASWTRDSFLYMMPPEEFEKRFAKMV